MLLQNTNYYTLIKISLKSIYVSKRLDVRVLYVQKVIIFIFILIVNKFHIFLRISNSIVSKKEEITHIRILFLFVDI